MGSAGRGSKADPPPEMREKTRSLSSALRRSWMIFTAPFTPLSLGIGCDVSFNITFLVLKLDFVPCKMLMKPSVMEFTLKNSIKKIRKNLDEVAFLKYCKVINYGVL